MSWSKSSDWLPLKNAQAQVRFWERDLAQSEKYLKYVRSHSKDYRLNYVKILRNAIRDVATSREGLKRARAKLAESENLEKQ